MAASSVKQFYSTIVAAIMATCVKTFRNKATLHNWRTKQYNKYRGCSLGNWQLFPGRYKGRHLCFDYYPRSSAISFLLPSLSYLVVIFFTIFILLIFCKKAVYKFLNSFVVFLFYTFKLYNSFTLLCVCVFFL